MIENLNLLLVGTVREKNSILSPKYKMYFQNNILHPPEIEAKKELHLLFN